LSRLDEARVNGAGSDVDQVDLVWKAEADEVMRKVQRGGRGQPIAMSALRRLPCETMAIAVELIRPQKHNASDSNVV
jgi:hypothetical protein